MSAQPLPAQDTSAPNKDKQGTVDKTDQESVEKTTEKPKATTKNKNEAQAAAQANDNKSDDNKSDDNKSDNGKSAKDEEHETPPAVGVHHLPLSGTYVDLIQPMSFDPLSLAMGGAPAKQKSFYRLCSYIDDLADKDGIDYVVLDLSAGNLNFNSAQLDELTRRIKQLSESDKKTVAWLENADNVHLALAATCDEVLMADFGGVDMPSVAMESMFYRDAMDLVGVKASVVRAGDFKGAVEPYINPVMSEHLRGQYLAMLKSINGAQVSRIADGRGMKASDVRELQKRRILLPKQALSAGLVDKLAPHGSMKETIDHLIGEPTKWTSPKKKAKRDVSFFELMGMIMAGPGGSTGRLRDNTIAVIHLSGPIIDGTSSSGSSIVSGPTVKGINAIANEDRIKGAVIRVNSPGGSATASEAIRQALVRLSKKKPTVVSMGMVAASGGYWVSCIDAPIYAEKGTITGSIGVFSMKLSLGTLLRRVGVHVESITLDDAAAAYAIDRAWDDKDIARMQGTIDHVYDRFVELVSKNRSMSTDQVKKLAGGRVWSGEQAKANGLIDSIGGLDDCLAVVAKKAKLDDFNIVHRPKTSGGLNLSDLLGTPDSDEISWPSVSRELLKVLKQRGFAFETTATILRDAMQKPNQQPTIWLLNPAEMSIR